MTFNQVPKTNIFDLNTDCLIEICKILDNENLLNLKIAHKAFGDAIDTVVSTRDIQFIECWNEENIESAVKEMKKSAKFLTQFGHKLKRLSIDVRDVTAAFDSSRRSIESLISCHYQTLIESFCSNGNVKYCSFSNFDMPAEFLKDNFAFFDSLDYLEIEFNYGYKTKIPDFMLLLHFIATTKIKNLRISIEFDYTDIKDNILPIIATSQLESLEIRTLIVQDLDYVDDNIPINTTLKILHCSCCLYSFDLRYLSHFPNIESLVLNPSSSSCDQPDFIANLNKLQKLTLVSYFGYAEEYLPVVPNLAIKNSLKFLQLSCLIYYPDCLSDMKMEKEEVKQHEDKLASALSKMTNLEELILQMSYSFERYLPQIGRNLYNLKKITYSKNNDKLNYVLSKLLQFVHEARNLTELTLYLDLKEQSQYFYDNLVRIRRSQAANAVLCVTFKGSSNVLKSVDHEKYVKILQKSVADKN